MSHISLLVPLLLLLSTVSAFNEAQAVEFFRGWSGRILAESQLKGKKWVPTYWHEGEFELSIWVSVLECEMATIVNAKFDVNEQGLWGVQWGKMQHGSGMELFPPSGWKKVEGNWGPQDDESVTLRGNQMKLQEEVQFTEVKVSLTPVA